MRCVVRCITAFLEAEDGPTAVEYAIMLGMIIVVCVASLIALGGNANQTFGTVAGSLAPSDGAQPMTGPIGPGFGP